MRFAPYHLLALLALLAAAPAQAELYKWVDAKGVTNYSSTPPSAKAKSAAIEDRVSVIPSDPAWREAAAISAARPDYANEEWLQRQRLMALKDSYTAVAYPVNDYYSSYPYYYGGLYPAHPIARARAVRAVAGPHPAPRGAVAARPAPRGALVR